MGLNRMIEDGEYGLRDGLRPRKWHTEFLTQRRQKILDSQGQQGIFSLFAGTGAGKTIAAGLAATESLTEGRVRRVVVGAPTKLIASQIRDTFRRKFGIHLAVFKSERHWISESKDQQGYVFLYPGLARNAAKHHRISGYEKTLVILDEVHHLRDSEKEKWGSAAQFAFGDVPEILTMTGSPFRPKGSFIPFATYVPTDKPGVGRFVADYSCTLGRCIADGYCREPKFHFSEDGVVKVRPPEPAEPYTVTFKEKLDGYGDAVRLKGAVTYGSETRTTLLRNSLAEIHNAHRKCVIFLGGDTTAKKEAGEKKDTPTIDATELLPAELMDLGCKPEEFMTITMADKDPAAKLKEFRESKTAWILITVNMFSEGADAPEISAAIFLTTWVSPLSFVQRVGRPLRFMDNGDPIDAWIYLFHHDAYRNIAAEIETEIKAEAAMAGKRKREAPARDDDSPRSRTEAIGISGGNITLIVRSGVAGPAHVWDEAEKECERHGISKAWLADMVDRKIKGGLNGYSRVV